MFRECGICGQELDAEEIFEVCADCRQDLIFHCSLCGVVLGWEERAHVRCQRCREIKPETSAMTGRGV